MTWHLCSLHHAPLLSRPQAPPSRWEARADGHETKSVSLIALNIITSLRVYTYTTFVSEFLLLKLLSCDIIFMTINTVIVAGFYDNSSLSKGSSRLGESIVAIVCPHSHPLTKRHNLNLLRDDTHLALLL